MEFTLDCPPSANRMTRYVPGKGNVHSSTEYRQWLKVAAVEVMIQRKGKVFSGPVRVLVAVRKPHPLADLDNFSISQVFDALQRGGALINDNQVHEFTAKWVNLGTDRITVSVDNL